MIKLIATHRYRNEDDRPDVFWGHYERPTITVRHHLTEEKALQIAHEHIAKQGTNEAFLNGYVIVRPEDNGEGENWGFGYQAFAFAVTADIIPPVERRVVAKLEPLA